MVPVLYLAGNGADRTMFGGAYMVDNYALVMKALFLLTGYITILLSTNYIEEGDYYQGEYYVLLLTAILGMTIMASARDLVTIFVALETLSIPTYLLAGWRKHDARSNESSLKYYLMGVLSSAVMLYGMSIVYGMAGDTRLVEIAKYVSYRRRRASSSTWPSSSPWSGSPSRCRQSPSTSGRPTPTRARRLR